jgi:hypothetical protein
MRALPLFVTALLGAGCATTYDLAVMPQNSGKIYTGQATDNGYGEGPIAIDIEGKHFTGTWVQSVPTQAYGYVSGGYGWGGWHRWGGIGGTVTLDNPGGGEAKALLTAPDGSGLRCDFRNGDRRFGAGMCRDDSGRQYDVQLRAIPRA